MLHLRLLYLGTNSQRQQSDCFLQFGLVFAILSFFLPSFIYLFIYFVVFNQIQIAKRLDGAIPRINYRQVKSLGNQIAYCTRQLIFFSVENDRFLMGSSTGITPPNIYLNIILLFQTFRFDQSLATLYKCPVMEKYTITIPNTVHQSRFHAILDSNYMAQGRSHALTEGGMAVYQLVKV